jgi:hypothetical protein
VAVRGVHGFNDVDIRDYVRDSQSNSGYPVFGIRGSTPSKNFGRDCVACLPLSKS